MSKDDEIKQAYFKWLCGLVDIRRLDHGRQDLAWLLHNIVFYGFVPNDDNRAEDGKKLRERFFEENSTEDCECLDGQCSFLEMLVALAERMDFILWEPARKNRMSTWFWKMVDNLELEMFLSDDEHDERQRKHYLNQVKVDKMLSRKYLPSGKGGIFPLKKKSGEDQTRVEIWYQLMAYLDENYII